MRVEVDRIVISGLPEAPAVEELAEGLRRELGEALAGVQPSSSAALGSVEAEVAAAAEAPKAVAAAVRDAVGGGS